MVKGWRQVSLPEEFYSDIQRFVEKHPELGYASVAEFVRTASREKIERWKKENPNYGVD